MTSTRAKARDKRQLSSPVLRRDLVPFYSAIDRHYEAGMHGGVLAAETLPTYTKGLIKRVTKGGKVTVKHEDSVDLGMPAMPMVFRVADAALLDTLSKGAGIEFLADRVDGKLSIKKIK